MVRKLEKIESLNEKKISIIINSLEGGGTEKHLLLVVNFLKKFFEIEIFSFSDGRLKNSFLNENINVIVPRQYQNSLLCFASYLWNTFE